MTAIAYRNGVIAADTNIVASNSGGEVSTTKNFRKIAKGKNVIGGFSGSARFIPRYISWIEKENGDLDTIPKYNISGLVAYKKGREISLFNLDDGFLWPMNVEWAAEGSALFFLTGALAAGASAKEAVKLAMEYVPNIGGKIESVSL